MRSHCPKAGCQMQHDLVQPSRWAWGLPDGSIEPFRCCERNLREAEECYLEADLGLLEHAADAEGPAAA